MPNVSLKLRLSGDRKLGPGKIRLLELIGELGSIWAAGREMKMSYGRAWNLTSELNTMFDEPMIAAHRGGSKRGGATLTARGEEVVRHYRSIEALVMHDSGDHLRALDAMLPGHRAVRPGADEGIARTESLPADSSALHEG
ncbi:MAG: LysR family transcriptional regulator [Candidatus Eremiobacteraeota bacterium]|nr:LysR family transcriptional regulator [Candidatus Eremiobacteraeota bacterium]